MPRTIGVITVSINIALSIVTCLKGELTLGLVSVFVPPVGRVTAVRLARPGSIWAQLSYPSGSSRLERARARFHAGHSRLERPRIHILDVVAGAPTPTTSAGDAAPRDSRLDCPAESVSGEIDDDVDEHAKGDQAREERNDSGDLRQAAHPDALCSCVRTRAERHPRSAVFFGPRVGFERHIDIPPQATRPPIKSH
jgi:hypothetical protein